MVPLRDEHHQLISRLQIDGEWQQCIIDDKLYLRAADYDESVDERPIWDDINRKDTEEEYRKVWQTGSRALYFAQCADENETWLPLLEKAYAKAHGDYTAIEGGFVGYVDTAPDGDDVGSRFLTLGLQRGDRGFDGRSDLRDLIDQHSGQRQVLERGADEC